MNKKYIECLKELAIHGSSVVNITHQYTWFEVTKALTELLNEIKQIQSAPDVLTKEKELKSPTNIGEWRIIGYNECLKEITPIFMKLQLERNAFQTQAGARKRECFVLKRKIEDHKIESNLEHDVSGILSLYGNFSKPSATVGATTKSR